MSRHTGNESDCCQLQQCSLSKAFLAVRAVGYKWQVPPSDSKWKIRDTSCDYRGPPAGDSVAGFPGARPFLQSLHFQLEWHSFLSARHGMSHISSSEPREIRTETVPTGTSGLLWPQSATERVVEPGQRGTQTASKPVFPKSWHGSAPASASEHQGTVFKLCGN